MATWTTRHGSRAEGRAWSSLALALAVACGSSSSGVPQDSTGGQSSGPMLPIPASLWRPPAGATPATGSYVYVEMDAGFTVGVTYPRVVTPATGSVGVTAEGGALSVAATDTVVGLALRGVFNTMIGHPRLDEGYYHDLRGIADADPLRGSLDVTLNSRGCAPVTGWFVVDHVFYFNGRLTAMDLRFEQRCPGFGPMHGQVHWTENLT
ncbi:MAG: hypothetical protein ABI601_06965 [bacterium]